MSIIQKIKKLQLEARKTKNSDKISLFTTLLSDITMVGKNKGNRDSTDGEAIAIIKQYINNANENLALFEGKFDASVDKFKNELNILTELLPTQLSEDELSDKIVQLIQSNNFSTMKDMGKVMNKLKESYDGLYDGTIASKIVKDKLGNK